MRARPTHALLASVALVLLLGWPASAELRINDLDVYLNDHEVTVHVVALGALGATLQEGLGSGLPANVRFTIELWQYNRLWRDRLLITHVVERLVTYNVVTREYRINFDKGEGRAPYTTRELQDAQRVISEVRSAKLTPASALDPAGIIYVRVHAETALSGEHNVLSRMVGTAEQAVRQSDYRSLMRTQ
jgi:Domain of unknown function (DUF4390)